MNYLDEEEIIKLKNSSLTKEERELLHLMKLFKLNLQNDYKKFILSLNTEEVDYIEDLIHKREGIINTELNFNSSLRKKVEEFIKQCSDNMLKNFKIILWEKNQ